MARQNTQRQRHRQRKGATRKKYHEIEHHHLLLRMETQKCPGPGAADKAAAGHLLHRIVTDIHMKPLDIPRVYYVSVPHYNEGLTAIMPIQTSHIAFHFWKQPEPAILKSRNSQCLLEFDIYTCGSLNSQQIQKVLRHLAIFKPTRVDATVINRKWSMTIDRHLHWSMDGDESWEHWITRISP